jgi:protein-S-isoprenylcysteine O-methyltransferase Ste14
MKRTAILLYGVFSYAMFFATFLYAIGWVGNIVVPRTIDGAPDTTLPIALAVNAGLLALFAVQHSVMARKGFKRALTRVVPESAERSTYVLATSLAMLLMFWQWRPLGGVVWHVTDPGFQTMLWVLYASGWLIVLVTTFLINHFDLFGLRQVWLQFRGKEYTPLTFGTPGPYRYVRHPLYVGWFLAFWATPTMTATHLLFAVGTTLYILVAIRLEERDLVRDHPEYRAYRARTGMFLPQFRQAIADPEPAQRAAG